MKNKKFFIAAIAVILFTVPLSAEGLYNKLYSIGDTAELKTDGNAAAIVVVSKTFVKNKKNSITVRMIVDGKKIKKRFFKGAGISSFGNEKNLWMEYSEDRKGRDALLIYLKY